MSDSKELTVASLGDAVREKVRKAMFDAIPDDALDKLVANEFQRFFQTKTEYNREIPSDFQVIVKKQIEAAMHDRIFELVKKKVDEHVYNWDTTGSKTVSALVEAMAPAAMAGIMKHIAERSIEAIQQRGF